MKNQAKRIISLALTFVMLLSVYAAVSVSAKENNTVKVIVKNEIFSAESGAPWTGVLIDTNAALTGEDSVESVLERVIKENNYEFTVSDYGYISCVNGLAEYAANGSGGWMATLNDWFTSDATTSYTVANGGLKAGDEIVMQYSCSWGADIGSLYGNFDTSLQGLTVENGTLAQSFSPSVTNYILLIDSSEAEISVIPEALNKNYQVKTYLNEYLPESDAHLPYKKPFTVKDGDTVSIGIGNPAWPSMNTWSGTAEETVYTLHVSSRPFGDLDGSGKANINDATLLQRYLAEYITLDDAQLAIADFNGDGKITINDVTALQCYLAEM